MCGLAGFIGKFTDEEKDELVTSLFLNIEERGMDASGLFTLVGGKSLVKKLHMPASEFVENLPDRYGNFAMLHVRAATHGSPTNNINNHPIIGGKYAFTHNGIVWNKRIKGYSYNSQTDSEVLLSYIERLGITKGLEYTQGSAAIVFADKYDPDTIYLFRHNNPLSIGYIEGRGFVYASTEGELEETLDDVFGRVKGIFPPASVTEVSEDTLISIHISSLDVNVEKIDVVDRYVPTTYYGRGFYPKRRKQVLPNKQANLEKTWYADDAVWDGDVDDENKYKW